MSYSGRYHPRHPEKYMGDANNIVYRSTWECRVMSYFDDNQAVIAWKSEEFSIPYYDPVKAKFRRYFPDFWVKVRTKNGTTKEIIFEVKPKAQTKEPKFQKKVTKKYITEVCNYGTNQAKWEAAQKYCAERNMEFHILTEDQIFGKNPHK